MPDREAYRGLCQRIVQRCRVRDWYGPDGTLRHLYVTHNPYTGFEFALATLEQLQATEGALGFALPPLLRAV